MVCTLLRKRDLGIRILSIYFFYQTLFGTLVYGVGVILLSQMHIGGGWCSLIWYSWGDCSST